MNYYLVLRCKYDEVNNKYIVHGVELTIDIPTYVTKTNEYVYCVLNSTTYDINAVMTRLVNNIGTVSVNVVPTATTVVNMSQISSGSATSRKIPDGEWNDVVRPAWNRAAHVSSFLTV